MNILFVCSMARMRSKTASECLKSVKHPTKYCGTDSDSDVKLSRDLIDWADRIICMENRHKSKIRRKFKGVSGKIEVWNIEDIYHYQDDSLIAILRHEYDRRGYYSL